MDLITLFAIGIVMSSIAHILRPIDTNNQEHLVDIKNHISTLEKTINTLRNEIKEIKEIIKKE